MKIEKIKYVSDLLKKYPHQPPLSEILFLNITEKDEIINELDKLNIRYETTFNGLSIELSLNNLGVTTYYDTDSFLKRTNENTFQNDFAILSYLTSYLYYHTINNETFTGHSSGSDNYFISNIKAYLNFISCLRNCYSDYFNEYKTELVYYTSTKGIFKLSIPEHPTYAFINPETNIAPSIQRFIDKSNNESFLIFIKNKLFDFNNEFGEAKVYSILTKIEVILESAERDYEIYLKNFSFDELLNGLRKKKEEYFASNREILSKILAQVISFPVSVSAALFALNKLDNQLFILFIIISFSIYVFYVVHIELIYLADLRLLKDQLEIDFKIIFEKSGLEHAEIEKGKQIVNNKLKNTEATLITFCSLFTIASLAFLFILRIAFPTYDNFAFLIIFSLLISLVIRIQKGFENNILNS